MLVMIIFLSAHPPPHPPLHRQTLAGSVAVLMHCARTHARTHVHDFRDYGDDDGHLFLFLLYYPREKYGG